MLTGFAGRFRVSLAIECLTSPEAPDKPSFVPPTSHPYPSTVPPADREREVWSSRHSSWDHPRDTSSRRSCPVTLLLPPIVPRLQKCCGQHRWQARNRADFRNGLVLLRLRNASCLAPCTVGKTPESFEILPSLPPHARNSPWSGVGVANHRSTRDREASCHHALERHEVWVKGIQNGTYFFLGRR